jgi:hypothetical protein
MCSREGKKRKKWLLGFLILRFQKIINRIYQISILGIQENGKMLYFFSFSYLTQRVTPLERQDPTLNPRVLPYMDGAHTNCLTKQQ